MCSFGERHLTVQGREADAGRLRFGGSGSALLAARGNCGPCFVRGKAHCGGWFQCVSAGFSASWPESERPAPAGPRELRACGRAAALVCFSESGESLLKGGARRASDGDG